MPIGGIVFFLKGYQENISIKITSTAIAMGINALIGEFLADFVEILGVKFVAAKDIVQGVFPTLQRE